MEDQCIWSSGSVLSESRLRIKEYSEHSENLNQASFYSSHDLITLEKVDRICKMRRLLHTVP